MKDKLLAPFVWRYDKYFSPYVELWGGVGSLIEHTYSTPKKIQNCKVAYIYANRRNVGDYISFLGIKELLGLDGPELFCAPIWHRQLIKSLNEIKQVNKNCLIVVGGGGLMQPVFTPFWDALLKSGLRYALMGIGINLMKGRPSLDTQLISKISNSASWIAVRDEYTQEIISSHLNQDREVKLGVCPSVNFVANRYSEYSPDKRNKLLHLMHPSDLRFSNVDGKIISENLKQIADSLNMQYEEHDNMSSSYMSALSRIYESRIVVTSRLHGCIISYAMGVPYVPLDCDKKIQSFLNTHDHLKKAHSPGAFEKSNSALELMQQELDSKGSNKREVLKKIELNRNYAAEIRSLITCNSSDSS